MRILMVTEDIPAPQVGGLGKHVVALSNALIDAGNDVELLGREDVDYRTHELEIGFKGRFIPGFRMDRNGWKESQLGVWMPYKRRALAGRIEDAITKHAGKFDVVHYHGHLPTVGLGLPASIPLLQTRHDQGAECVTHQRFRGGAPCKTTEASDCAGCATAKPNWVQIQVSSFAVRQYRQSVAKNIAFRKTLFVSDFLLSQFKRAVPEANVASSEVLHNFVDLKRLNSIARNSGSVIQGTVLLVGRLDEAKGFAQFLDAWARFGQAGARVIIVGDGAMRGALEKAYGHIAEFRGWLLNDLVVEQTRSAHVCVVPSVCEEAFGLTTLEALVLGRPCVALSRGGTPELVAYARYEGQLRLGRDMDEVVSLVNRELARPAAELPLAEECAADLEHVLPRILGIYRNVGAATPPSM